LLSIVSPLFHVTPLKGIRQKLPNKEVKYAVGSSLAERLPIFTAIPNSVLFTDNTKTVNGLNAEYFDNLEFKGKPKYTRVDETVDFTWRTDSPFEDLAYDKYAIRWTGTLVVDETRSYALGAEAFSSVKLYLDDKLLISRTDDHHPNKTYEDVKLTAGKKYKIRFECTQDNTEHSIMRLLWGQPTNNLEAEALAIAKESDAIIMCMGISPLLEGEEMKVKVDGFAGGDRLNTKLPKIQSDLIKKITALGKPTVLVLLNGSALSINWENENVPAVLEAWYPGQAGGTAIADVIFGDYNPAGRLPVTFYKDINDIPPFKDYSMKGKTYRYFKGDPLYEFGYGLSYTSFKYSNFKVPNSISANDKTFLVEVDVENTGDYKGDDVVQVYIYNENVDEFNPHKSLVAFDRIPFKKGEKKTLKFEINKDQLSVVTEKGEKVVLPGEYKISVGGGQSSAESIKEGSVVLKTISIL
jgi:beta-glucosidase